jgi:hypothetical protein
MGDVPTVNTSTWRLPKKGHRTPEASYTDDMYRAKGLPVDPDRAPTTGASGLPTVSTEDWVTPSTRARRLEEAKTERQHDETFEVELDDEEFVDLGDDYDRQRFSDLEGDMDEAILGERKPRGVGRRKSLPSTWSKSERKGKGRGPSAPSGSSKRWERRGAKKEIEAQRRGEDVEPEGDEVVEMGCGSKPKKSLLKKKKRPMKEATGDVAVLKKLAQKTGLSKYGPMTGFHPSNIGQYADYMLNPTQGVSVKLHATASGVKWSIGDKVRGETSKGEVKYGELSKLVPVLKKMVAKHGAREEQVESVRSVQRRLAGLEQARHLEFATGTPYRRMPSTTMLQETELDPIGESNVELGETEFDLPDGQRALAGLTERAPLPHPLHDTMPVRVRRAHGILDDGKDGGEEFVEQVLAESRWFFRDFGDLALGAKKRPFDEAPGGRAGPWRGSEDEPAETPIVRKGKVKGTVGDDQEPEDDEKQPPPTKKSKAKAPPPKEPEEGDEEEQEEQVEAEGHSYLKRGGSRLKALGHKMAHGGAAQKAKEGLKKRLHKFVVKHGIKAMGHDPDAGKKKPKMFAKKRKKITHAAPLVGPKMKRPGESKK